MSMDEWTMLLQFCREISPDCDNFQDDGAWPVCHTGLEPRTSRPQAGLLLTRLSLALDRGGDGRATACCVMHDTACCAMGNTSRAFLRLPALREVSVQVDPYAT